MQIEAMHMQQISINALESKSTLLTVTAPHTAISTDIICDISIELIMHV